MKKINLILAILLIMISIAYSQDPAILDLESTTQGALMPRMTTVQRDAIVTPAQSLLVYDTDTKSFWYYEDNTWNELLSSGTSSFNDGLELAALMIPDNDPGGVEDIITLSDPRIIDASTNIEICIDVTHTYTGDLTIELIAPDGVTILPLVSALGFNSQGFINTCFTTNATIDINTASFPFTGNFIPITPFLTIYGQPIAGDWTLKIVDEANADLGTLDSWSISMLKAGNLNYNISDTDEDTKIEAEKNYDEDVLRFTAADTEVLSLSSSDATFSTNVTAPAFVGDGSLLTGISSSGSNTFYYEFSDFSNSSCCNDMILQQASQVTTASAISVNSTQPKHAYGKALSFDVEIVSVKFLHRYYMFNVSGAEPFTVQPGIATFDGVLDRYVTAPIDLRTLPQNVWNDIPLTSSVPADNLVDASALQYIVWQLNSVMAGSDGDDVSGVCVLQVEVKIP